MKPKLTPDVTHKICDLIRNGQYKESAARAAGVAKSTFFLWQSMGEKGEGGKKYRDFYLAVQEAEAASEVFLVTSVIKDGGWRGKLEVLKRRFPERWGDRHRMEHSTPDGPMAIEGSGTGGPAVTVVIGEHADVWNPEVHGKVEEATEDDLPDEDP